MTVTVADAVQEYSESRIETEGNFKTEDEAKSAFLTAFTKTECFNIYSEVDCWYFGGSVFGDKPTGRIDFVLTPRPSLIAKGWQMGCVGVEVKKSGHKAGPLICQMIDYSKAVFQLPEGCGCSLVCMTAVCSFPAFDNKGAIESITTNHRIGTVSLTSWGSQISIGSRHIFFSGRDGVRVLNINCGYKNGSR